MGQTQGQGFGGFNPYQALGPSPYSWLGNLFGGGSYGGYGPGEGYGQSPGGGGQQNPYMQGTPTVRNLVGQSGNLQGLIGQALGSQQSPPGSRQPNITDIVRQVGAMNTQRDQALAGTPNQGLGQSPGGFGGGGWGGWGAPQSWGGGMGGQRSKG